MSTFILKIVGLFLLVTGSGFWLSSSGRPLNTLPFTFHKLAALALVIYTVILIRNLLAKSEIQSVNIFLLIFTGVFLLTLFVSGGLLSFESTASDVVLAAHRVIAIISVVTTVITVFLLAASNSKIVHF